MVSIQYTPIPQQEVIIHPSTGMNSYATITTDSYLSQALHGMMQNAAGYIGWSLDQWIQAFTAQAQQRCASYPESCAGTTPEILGHKYGAIAFQLMQTVSTPVQQQSNPNGINQGQATYNVQSTVVPTGVTPTKQETQAGITSGQLVNLIPTPAQQGYVSSPVVQQGDASIPIPLNLQTQAYYNNPGFVSFSLTPDYVTQQSASQGAVSDNATQSQIAQSGGTPVAPTLPPGTVVLPAALSWLGNTFTVGGMNIPIWIPLAAVVGFMFMQGQGGHRRY